MNLNELKQMINNNTAFISDNHFGHLKVFEEFEPIRKEYAMRNKMHDLRGFESLMIRNWNAKVQHAHNILHLGDFCIDKRKPGEAEKNISDNTRKLNGQKILIKGNHDKSDNSVYIKAGWKYIIDEPVILLDEMKIIPDSPKHSNCIITEINGKRIMFSHFGIHQYDDRFEGKYKDDFTFLTELYHEYNCELNIHGHSHSNAVNSEKSFNVSVEVLNFTPKLLSEIQYSLLSFKK